MGSIPITRSICVVSAKGFAHIAQSVEHFLGKEEVTGSNPVMSSSCSFKGLSLKKWRKRKFVTRKFEINLDLNTFGGDT